MQQGLIKLLVASYAPQAIAGLEAAKEKNLSIHSVDSPFQLYQAAQSPSVDAVLVDIDWPQLDGIGLLRKVIKISSAMPHRWIMAISRVEDPSFMEYICRLGVSQYIKRKSLELNPEPVLSEMLIGIHQNRRQFGNILNIQTNARPLEQEVMEVLASLGTPMHVRGYQYLKTAIELTARTPSLVSAITKMLYPQLALMYDTSPSCVERAMRHAIQTIFQRSRSELKRVMFSAYLDVENERPTNSEFIATASNWIRMKTAAREEPEEQ